MKLTLSEHIKRSREAVAANKAKGNKHAELFATMYTQPSRFIEEILQNTEDAYSRKKTSEGINGIRFKLYEDKVEIHHNGKDFDENDLMSITTFANTTKKNNSEVNLIGKFGIGFKSVFSVTDMPEIHCGPHHYRITDYEVLSPCDERSADTGFQTLIILPFKRKSIQESFAIVKQGLSELNAYHLIFLKKLKRIEVFENNTLLAELHRTTDRLKKNIELRIIRKKSFAPQLSETKELFWVYTHEGRYQYKLPELAFKAIENEQGFSFDPVRDVPLFVYFPLKMFSGLNFLIHAPFTTNPLRDFALFDIENCPENLKLLNDSVSSFTEALSEFKSFGFYSVDLLAKLFVRPPAGEPSDRQKGMIQDKFFRAFTDFLMNGSNIPLGPKKFEKASQVLIPAEEAIYDLLMEADLKRLFQKPHFVDPAICGEIMTEFRNFLSDDLNIKTVDAESLAFRIKVNSGFLEGKPLHWFKSFYSYVHSHQKLWDRQHAGLFYSLRSAPFLLTDHHKIAAAYDEEQNAKIYLPGRRKSLLTTIHHKLAEDVGCMSFFLDMEIKTPDLVADVLHNIIPQLGKSSAEGYKDYVARLEKVIAAYQDASQNERRHMLELLQKSAWVLCEDGSGKKLYSLPHKAYVKNTLLASYFSTSSDVCFLDPKVYARLTKKYPEMARSFFSEVGIATFPRLHVVEGTSPTMEGFDEFLNNITEESSRIFAKLLIATKDSDIAEDVTQFLRSQPWIYNRKGVLVVPRSIHISELSGIYRFTEKEKNRLSLLMNMGVAQRSSEEVSFPWKPGIKPEEVAIIPKPDPIITMTDLAGNINLLNSMQAALHFGESKETKLKEYSDADLNEIQKWSEEFITRVLAIEFPEPEYRVERSSIADFVVFKNEEIIRYVFVSGKTDLMGQFPFTAGQLLNICKLTHSREITFLYTVNSVGTSAVTFRQSADPYGMLLNDSLQLSGRVFLKPE